MSKEKSNGTFINRVVFFAAIAVLLALILLLGQQFYHEMNELLYEESITQLGELSRQLIEKLDDKVDYQWNYLEKLQLSLERHPTLTEQELIDLLKKEEEQQSPIGKKLYFRLVDEDGHYYTNEGRLGYWAGLDQVTGAEHQSIMLADWADNETYMAFIIPASDGITVDGKKIGSLVLLRTMEDMRGYFYSSAFNNNNLAYITDYNGFILSSGGSLDGMEFEGKNLYSYLEKQTFPHAGSLNAVLEKGNPSGTVCTDMLINGRHYYLIYDRMPAYDWAMMLVVDSADVATGAAKMAKTLAKLFLIFALICVVLTAAIILFTQRFRSDQRMITAQRAYQARLEELNKDLEEERQRADEARQEAVDATKAKSQFLSSMSHDIRTPMNAILGMANLIEHELNDPTKVRYYVKKLQNSGTYMLGLINDILDMSKIESGDVQINQEPIKLAEQVGQIESIIRAQSNEKRQKLTVAVRELTHEYLIGDSIRLRQIFLNLLTNAVKYTPAGGAIRMEIAELPSDKPGYAMIRTTVRDNGYGMSPEFVAKIFQPFTREQNSTINKIQGTGLGMSITKSLVDLMGGTITVESEKDEGSTFVVTLPMSIDPNANYFTGLQSVLLISEDESLRANVQAALKETDISLRIASATDEALAMLREEHSDAVMVTDHLESDKLPETVRELREAAGNNVLVFCCGYMYLESVRAALVECSLDGLIARPFFFENLSLAVAHSRESNTVVSKAKPISSLKGKRFLCAEDNDLNAEILDALLSIHGAFCEIYPDGKALVEKFNTVEEGEYDAILMDVQMPNMNGMEATRVIRAGSNPLGRTIPIIAMTANAFSTDVEDCLNAGMDAHLAKPIDISGLERLVETLCDGTVQEEEESQE